MLWSQLMRRLLVPLLLPTLVRWISTREKEILARGAPLDFTSAGDAAKIGLKDAARVRLLRVQKVPLPGGRLVQLAERWTGESWSHTAGLTARYGIFIRADLWGDRNLIAHELVHTAQYERLGGILPFLRRYLTECLTTGYASAAMELEANATAAAVCR